MKQRVGDLLDQSVFGVCVVNEDTYDIFEPRLGRLPEPRLCVSINLLPTSSWSIMKSWERKGGVGCDDFNSTAWPKRAQHHQNCLW